MNYVNWLLEVGNLLELKRYRAIFLECLKEAPNSLLFKERLAKVNAEIAMLERVSSPPRDGK